jgi:hypothetical protein
MEFPSNRATDAGFPQPKFPRLRDEMRRLATSRTPNALCPWWESLADCTAQGNGCRLADLPRAHTDSVVQLAGAVTTEFRV